MSSTASLTGTHLRTYTTLYQHPLSHNLDWRTVRSLLEHVGQVAEEPNGNLKVTRNGQLLTLHPPRTKDVAEAEEIMALRSFLERSELPTPGTDGKEVLWLLIIDHRDARIFRSDLDPSSPQQILPYEPDDQFRHAHNSKDIPPGKEKSEPNRFFEPIASALKAAGQIVVFGRGKGMSSEKDQFLSWAKLRHPDLANRIVGTAVVDEQQLSPRQLLAMARDLAAKDGNPRR